MSDFSDAAQDLRGLGDDIEDKTTDGIEDGLETTHRRADALIRMKNIRYQGDLRRSGHVHQTPDGDGHQLSYGGPQAPHAAVLMTGTGPQYRTPDTDDKFGPYPAPSGISPELRESIGDWIKAKGIMAHSVPQDQLDWAIAASIVEKGTPRQPFLLPAWRSSKSDIISEAKRGLKQAVNQA